MITQYYLKNKFQFCKDDLVVEFEEPLQLEPAMKWFSKNCFNKRGISYEFACSELDNIDHDWPENRDINNFELSNYKDEEDLFNKNPDTKTLYVASVALHSCPLQKRLEFVNVIKSKYKVKRIGLIVEKED